MINLKEVMTRIKLRIKKYGFILIALPILTTVMSYYSNSIPMNRPQQIPVSSEIYLGYFEFSELNQPEQAIEKIKSTQFLKRIIEDGGFDIDLLFLQQQLIVSKASSTNVKITLNLEDEKLAVQIVDAITSHFLKESTSVYNGKVQLLKESLDSVENIPSNSEAAVDKERFSLVLKNSLMLKFQKPEIVTEPSILEEEIQTERTFTDMNRVVFGLIVGLIASILFLLTPEILRK